MDFPSLPVIKQNENLHYDLESLLEYLRHVSAMLVELEQKSDTVTRFALDIYQKNFWHWMQILTEQEEISMDRAIALVNAQRVKVPGAGKGEQMQMPMPILNRDKPTERIPSLRQAKDFSA